MTSTRRALCWFLTVVLLCTIGVMVTAEPDEQLDTTPTTWFSGPGDQTEVTP